MCWSVCLLCMSKMCSVKRVCVYVGCVAEEWQQCKGRCWLARSNMGLSYQHRKRLYSRKPESTHDGHMVWLSLHAGVSVASQYVDWCVFTPCSLIEFCPSSVVSAVGLWVHVCVCVCFFFCDNWIHKWRVHNKFIILPMRRVITVGACFRGMGLINWFD